MTAERTQQQLRRVLGLLKWLADVGRPITVAEASARETACRRTSRRDLELLEATGFATREDDGHVLRWRISKSDE